MYLYVFIWVGVVLLVVTVLKCHLTYRHRFCMGGVLPFDLALSVWGWVSKWMFGGDGGVILSSAQSNVLVFIRFLSWWRAVPFVLPCWMLLACVIHIHCRYHIWCHAATLNVLVLVLYLEICCLYHLTKCHKKGKFSCQEMFVLTKPQNTLNTWNIFYTHSESLNSC